MASHLKPGKEIQVNMMIFKNILLAACIALFMQGISFAQPIVLSYDDAIKTFKTGTNTEYKKAIDKLNKLRNEFYNLTGNKTEALEINL